MANEEQTTQIDDLDQKIENTGEAEELEEESEPRFSLPEIKLPKWLLIVLMIVPAGLIIGIILIIQYKVGFPTNINPIAIIGITGVSLVGITVLGDMAYRNFFVYRLMRRESTKARVYKQIMKDRKEEEKAKAKYEIIEDEYVYDEDSEEYEDFDEAMDSEEDEEDLEIDEYQYEEPKDEEEKYYKMKSLIFRGGLFSILLINGLILLIAAVILQATIGGGFIIASE